MECAVEAELIPHVETEEFQRADQGIKNAPQHRIRGGWRGGCRGHGSGLSEAV